MMKKIISVVLTIVMCLGLILGTTACHGKKAAAAFEIPESLDMSKDYEITFWAKNDTNKTQVDIYNRAIAEFEALYPNIKVNLRLYTDYGKIYNDVITNISTGTTPNVCITYPDHIATYISGENIVVPLDELIADEKYGLGGTEVKFDSPTKEEIISEFLGECQISGVQYALPYMRSTEALYINKTYVEKLGYEIPDVLTWDFVFEVSEKATEKMADGETFKVNGQKVMLPFIYKSSDNMMIHMLNQLGADYSDDKGNIKIFNDRTKEILYEIKKHALSKSFTTFKIVGYPANFLNAGQCIFAIDSTAGATWMGSDAPLLDIPENKIVEFETVVRPIPQYDVNNISMISQGPSICIFNKTDSNEVLASWLFAQYLLTNSIQIAYAETEGYVPVTSKAQNASEYIDYLSRSGEDNELHYSIKIDATKLLLANTSNTFTTPVFNGSASLRDVAGQLIDNVVKSVNRKQTVDEAFMTKLFTDVAAQYHINQPDNDGGNSSTTDLGELPNTSKWLLGIVGGVWIIMAICFVYAKLKKKAK